MIIDEIRRPIKNINLNYTQDTKNEIFDIMYETSLQSGMLSHNAALDKYINTDNRVIFIAGAPKSGSTFLCGCISELLNYLDFPIALHGMNENDLNLFMLLITKTLGDGKVVARSHTKASYFTVEYLKRFNIQPIISIRNIYDTIISIARDVRNHHLNGKRASYAFLWQTDACIRYDDTKFLDYIIDMAVPWYANFYASWYSLAQEEDLNCLFIGYRELMNNKIESIKNIFSFLKIENYSLEKLSNYTEKFYKNDEIDHGANNILPLDCGKQVLSAKQVNRINTILGYFNDIPFTEYEIDNN